MKTPGDIPYKWFWVLGAVLGAIAVLSAFQGNLLLMSSLGLAGVAMLVLGFVERHRGAPPV